MLALVATSLFTNEGALAVTDRARLTLGGDGATETLTNTGDVYVGSDGVATGMRGDLAIRGKYTVNGAGSIQLLGDGSRIVSDGVAASTLFNQSEIFAVADRQIGDAGGYPSANGLGLANSGSVVVLGQQNTLTLNTGSNRIDDGGGLLEAAAGVCATKAACGKISAAPTPQLEQNAFFLNNHTHPRFVGYPWKLTQLKILAPGMLARELSDAPAGAASLQIDRPAVTGGAPLRRSDAKSD